jgi:hypothetical protein
VFNDACAAVEQALGAFTLGDVEPLVRMFAPDGVWYLGCHGDAGQLGHDAIRTALHEVSASWGGTLVADIHDAFVDDQHVVVLLSETGEKFGEPQQYSAVHIFHIVNDTGGGWRVDRAYSGPIPLPLESATPLHYGPARSACPCR